MAPLHVLHLFSTSNFSSVSVLSLAYRICNSYGNICFGNGKYFIRFPRNLAVGMDRDGADKIPLSAGNALFLKQIKYATIPDMVEIRTLLKIFDPASLMKGMLLLLLYSIVPIGELVLILYLGQLWGNYLILAITAITGLFGFFLSVRKVRSITESIKKRVADGSYPGEEFVRLAGALVGSLLLITPGFVTDIVGFLLLFSFPQVWVGRSITRKMEDKLKELYEYLKL